MPKARPVGVRGGQGRRLALDVERGGGGAPGVVGLIAARVEGGHHRVADELVDLAPVVTHDRGNRGPRSTR
jgi:hypothetical protein